MDFTALCINILMVVMVLLVAQVTQSDFVQNAGEAFQPRITPDRLQFFLYDKINISCEQIMGLTEWRVMLKPFTKVQTSVHSYDQSTPAYEIPSARDSHSGKYWCENADGETSNAVNITVTDGEVILDVPASPVIEGHDVSLFCQYHTLKKQHIAEFYKDDSLLETAYDSKLTIRNVSRSDESLYKCITEAGESPESWLSVKKMGKKYHPELQSPVQHVSLSPPQHVSHPPPQHVSHPPPQHVSHPPSYLWIVSGAMLTVLLVSVLGLILCQKHKVICGMSRKSTPSSRSSEGQTAEHSDADLHQATYAVVKKLRKNKVPSGDTDLESDHVTYAQIDSFRFEKGSNRSSRRQKNSLLGDGDIYSTIRHI